MTVDCVVFIIFMLMVEVAFNKVEFVEESRGADVYVSWKSKPETVTTLIIINIHST